MKFEVVTYDDLYQLESLQPPDWPDIKPEFDFYINSQFCHPVMKKIDNKVVAIGALMVFGETAWIGHMIVDNNFRRRGIAFQLLNELLKNLNPAFTKTCLLVASEMGRSVYLKAGFRDVAEYAFFQRAKPWRKRSHNRYIIPYQESFRTMIFDLDKTISGESRELLLTDFLTDSQLFIRNNKVEGYYLPHLKEGPVIADTEEAGLALMEVKYAKADRATLPIGNTTGIKFLQENGFVRRNKTGTRMVWGRDINWKPTKIYSRIGGNFG